MTRPAVKFDYPKQALAALAGPACMQAYASNPICQILQLPLQVFRRSCRCYPFTKMIEEGFCLRTMLAKTMVLPSLTAKGLHRLWPLSTGSFDRNHARLCSQKMSS